MKRCSAGVSCDDIISFSYCLYLLLVCGLNIFLVALAFLYNIVRTFFKYLSISLEIVQYLGYLILLELLVIIGDINIYLLINGFYLLIY